MIIVTEPDELCAQKDTTLVVVGKKMTPMGSGSIGKCGFIRAGVPLLEAVCHHGGGL